MTHEGSAESDSRGRISHFFRMVRAVTLFSFDACVDALGRNVRLMWSEFNLFFGAVLTVLGLLSFEVDRFCDGTSANYLSCTRPSTFYYYDWLDTTLILVGSTYILLWVVQRMRNGR